MLTSVLPARPASAPDRRLYRTNVFGRSSSPTPLRSDRPRRAAATSCPTSRSPRAPAVVHSVTLFSLADVTAAVGLRQGEPAGRRAHHRRSTRDHRCRSTAPPRSTRILRSVRREGRRSGHQPGDRPRPSPSCPLATRTSPPSPSLRVTHSRDRHRVLPLRGRPRTRSGPRLPRRGVIPYPRTTGNGPAADALHDPAGPRGRPDPIDPAFVVDAGDGSGVFRDAPATHHPSYGEIMARSKFDDLYLIDAKTAPSSTRCGSGSTSASSLHVGPLSGSAAVHPGHVDRGRPTARHEQFRGFLSLSSVGDRPLSFVAESVHRCRR